MNYLIKGMYLSLLFLVLAAALPAQDLIGHHQPNHTVKNSASLFTNIPIFSAFGLQVNRSFYTSMALQTGKMSRFGLGVGWMEMMPIYGPSYHLHFLQGAYRLSTLGSTTTFGINLPFRGDLRSGQEIITSEPLSLQATTATQNLGFGFGLVTGYKEVVSEVRGGAEYYPWSSTAFSVYVAQGMAQGAPPILGFGFDQVFEQGRFTVFGAMMNMNRFTGQRGQFFECGISHDLGGNGLLELRGSPNGGGQIMGTLSIFIK